MNFYFLLKLRAIYCHIHMSGVREAKRRRLEEKKNVCSTCKLSLLGKYINETIRKPFWVVESDYTGLLPSPVFAKILDWQQNNLNG